MKKVLQVNKYMATGYILVLALLFSLAGCNDYGKEIEQLQSQVSELQKSINALKEAHESGKIISQVVSAEESNGYEIVFSDGSKIALNHGNNGADGNDGNDGADGVTPIIKIDSEGYWIVSYDDEVTFTRILDDASNPIPAIAIGSDGLPGEDGKCVRVTTGDDGLYVFEVYSPSSPDQVIDKVVTPYSSNPSSAIASIVKDEESGKIVLTMRDGSVFEFNLDVAYPTSLIVLEDVVHIAALKDGVITFRLNPSDAYVSLQIDGSQPTLELDVVTPSSRSGDNISYVNPPKGYKITSVKQDETEDGDIKQGQYKAEISSLNNGENPSERVCLVLTTKNSKGETIRISSTPFAIVNGEGTDVLSVTINGVEAEKTGNVFLVKLPPTTDLKSLTPKFIGNCTSISAKQADSYDFSSPVTFVATGPDGKTEEYTVAVTFSNLPVVYVTTPAPIVSKDDWVKNCAIQIVNSDNAGTYESVQMKGRGNSTWGYPKKPYAIKLDKKAEVLGMPKHKRWVLLANYGDFSDLRTEASMFLGRQTTLEYTPRTSYIEVVLNGTYQGLYQMTEQLKIDENRVAVGDDGFLLEIDARAGQDPDDIYFKDSGISNPVVIKDPDVVSGSPEYEYIRMYISSVTAALKEISADANTTGFLDLIDLNSFIDWYLVNEITRNNDACFWSSCYMHLKRGDKLKMGPLWDFDLAIGNTDTNDSRNPIGFWLKNTIYWYQLLFQSPQFVTHLKEHFNKLYEDRNRLYEYIRQQRTLISEPYYNNELRWNRLNIGSSIDVINSSHEDRVESMINWLETRFNWMKNEFDKL